MYQILPLACLVFVIGLGIYWILGYRSRVAGDLNSMLDQLDPHLKSMLLTHSVLDSAKQRSEDDELWRSIHGIRGVRRICHNAGILANFAFLGAQECPDLDLSVHEDLCQRAAMLRLSMVGCVVECLILKAFSSLPLPRLFARWSVEQYVEICAEMRAVVEYHHPSLISRFDTSI